ncbi:hypothetical protein Plhal304r1_c032g0102681 [Plasmopara halstedii]
MISSTRGRAEILTTLGLPRSLRTTIDFEPSVLLNRDKYKSVKPRSPTLLLLTCSLYIHERSCYKVGLQLQQL